jgi:hypothetical protein
MEVLSSSETSVFTRTTQRNISEDSILQSPYHENLKSYNGEGDLLELEHFNSVLSIYGRITSLSC